MTDEPQGPSGPTERETEPGPAGAEGLEQLLEHLRDARGFDFTSYKRGTLGRRIAKRMATVGIDNYVTYQELLEAEPHEFAELFDTILINVTSFLRDPDAWHFLAESVVPEIVAAKQDDEPIRAWSAGCASGEEAYSLAVLLSEVVGEDAFRHRVKVYGTDVDEHALATARQGRYPVKELETAFSPEQIERYFEPEGNERIFRRDLRRSVIFGRHDLVQDAPISRVDLLACRNTLMYFNGEAQKRILGQFQFALTENGVLFLGKSEALAARATHFLPFDSERHAFVKRHAVTARTPAAAGSPPVPAPSDLGLGAFDSAPVAQFVVDQAGVLALANRQARALLGLGLNQIGRPFKDLELSYRPLELRSKIEEVLTDRRPTLVNEVRLPLAAGIIEFVDVYLAPLTVEGESAAVSLTFMEVGRYKLLREELERSQRELEVAYEELQSINEELETTNEELHSTNEELETTNEELHSTNEELETMNEELHSTNEELETTNSELRLRTYDLDEANVFLESILGSLGSGVIVLNRQLAVRVWNRKSEDLWGLRADEVLGEQFLTLDIGLPVDRLGQPLSALMSGQAAATTMRLPAVNRRGRSIECDVRLSPLQVDGTPPEGVILLMTGVAGVAGVADEVDEADKPAS